MRKILKGAVVLLISMALVFSTVAIADTQTKVITPELSTTYSGLTNGARDDVVWDNEMDYDGLLAAQEPITQGNIDAYPADDFNFEIDTEVSDVHWIGGYFNGDPQEWDWCIIFYSDRGDGNAPGNVYAGEFCYSWADINMEEIEPGYYNMWVYLPESVWFYGGYKFWISIWAVGDNYPQSGWGYHADPIILHETVLKSEYFGVPYWTNTSELLGYATDQCFQLTKRVCEPSIDVEKYIWDEKNKDWVDADTEDAALDIKICTNIEFKIVAHNNGEGPLTNIGVIDLMEDSLKFISSDPHYDDYSYEPPNQYIYWAFPGPLQQDEIIEIYITAHVEGPECSKDFNKVNVEAYGCGTYVYDEDIAWVHAHDRARDINSPILNFLQNHPNLFPLLQKLLQQLGL